MIGNEIADLTKQREPMLRWLLFLAFCFHNRALWHGAKQKPTLFLPKTPSAYGMLLVLCSPWRLKRPASEASSPGRKAITASASASNKPHTASCSQLLIQRRNHADIHCPSCWHHIIRPILGIHKASPYMRSGAARDSPGIARRLHMSSAIFDQAASTLPTRPCTQIAPENRGRGKRSSPRKLSSLLFL